MKKFILVLVLGGLGKVGSAFADDLDGNEFEVQGSRGKWACVAYGYDQNNIYRGVPGNFEKTKKRAENSAVVMCIQSGWTACQVSNCYKY